MKAFRHLVVRASLPSELADLPYLMRNLRWSWHRPTRDLFEEIDPVRWRRVGHDPYNLLAEITAERMEELRVDGDFVRRLADARRDLDAYLADPGWYAEQQRSGAGWPTQIAYFSPEFGITEALPQYSGGLGILAGDHLKSASDLGVPLVAVGLFYRAGYFIQSLSSDGWQLETYPQLDPRDLPLTRLRTADGEPVQISIDLPHGRVLTAQVWRAAVGRVTLLLLDSDVESNGEFERAVTDRLYGGGKDQRIAQELLLGVGGVRALRAYSAVTGAPEPEVYHTNEGHAGFQGLERVREMTADGSLSFDEALQLVRASTVFTTHTPVPAGIDRFEKRILTEFLGDDRALPGVPLDRVMALGSENDPAMFNMAHLGFRLAQRANGVSKLHGAVSREMFTGLWSGFPAENTPITSVTNGVHAPTWVGRHMIDSGLVTDLSDEALWARRNESRASLVREVRRRAQESALSRGRSPAEIGWIESMFDPEVLTIGFARRVPSYKRLTLMLRDPARLRAILLDPKRPIQIVIAGKSHPADDGGKELIRQMVQFTDDPTVRHRITFLPDYDMAMARYLYAGCDVWLNNPLRPLEACGTSGMKAAMNGGLNLSILDGWWDELYDGINGWAIPTADGVHDEDRRDSIEADALYQLLENSVAPTFYDRSSDGMPTEWLNRVRHTVRTVAPQVDADRMVREYIGTLYAPSASASRALAADDGQPARDLTAWIERVRAAWPGVRVLSVEPVTELITGDDEDVDLGTSATMRAVVALAGLAEDDVSVQLHLGRVGRDGDLQDPIHIPMTLTERDGDQAAFEATVAFDRQGHLGYGVLVVPSHPQLASDAELGLRATT